MSVLTRNNVTQTGRGRRAMVFAHGYGCDQAMWRLVAPAFAGTHRVVLFDHVGAGGSDPTAYDRSKYASLHGYAEDLHELCVALDVRDGVFVGHSVSAMIGVLAAIRDPTRFSRLVLIGPSPRYVDDAGYVGGFSLRDVEELLELQDSNYLGWSTAFAPVVAGNPDRPELAAELANSFCRADPAIARQFAAVTFLSDNRADLPLVAARCLVLQCREDAIAPPAVGEYVRAQLGDSELVVLEATGHCPHLSAPDETIAAIKAFLAR